MNRLPLLAPLALAMEQAAALAYLRRQMRAFDTLRRECGLPGAKPLAMISTPDGGTARPPASPVASGNLARSGKAMVDGGLTAGQGSLLEPQKLLLNLERNAARERQHASIVRGAHEHVRRFRESGRLKSCAPDSRRVSDPRTACGLRNRLPFGNADLEDPTMSHGDSGCAIARPATLAASAHPAGLPYRPTYYRRALAHIASGSLPPFPRAVDLTPLAMPAVAALLGLLVGGML